MKIIFAIFAMVRLPLSNPVVPRGAMTHSVSMIFIIVSRISRVRGFEGHYLPLARTCVNPRWNGMRRLEIRKTAHDIA